MTLQQPLFRYLIPDKRLQKAFDTELTHSALFSWSFLREFGFINESARPTMKSEIVKRMFYREPLCFLLGHLLSGSVGFGFTLENIFDAKTNSVNLRSIQAGLVVSGGGCDGGSLGGDSLGGGSSDDGTTATGSELDHISSHFTNLTLNSSFINDGTSSSSTGTSDFLSGVFSGFIGLIPGILLAKIVSCAENGKEDELLKVGLWYRHPGMSPPMSTLLTHC